MIKLLPPGVDGDRQLYLEEEMLNLRYDIEAFVGHIVRAVVQGNMQEKVLETMGPDTVLIVVDGAMK